MLQQNREHPWPLGKSLKVDETGPDAQISGCVFFFFLLCFLDPDASILGTEKLVS